MLITQHRNDGKQARCLSSKGIKTGAMAAYYESLATQDYYANSDDPPGRWIGKGDERMGLDGEVKEGELRAASRSV